MSIPYELAVSEDMSLGYGDVTVTMPGGGTATGSKIGVHTFHNNTFNVKDFGARGDNARDDSAAIQAALDECHSAGGGTVTLPAGTYRIGTPLDVGDFTTVVGAQGWNSKLRAIGDNYCVNFVGSHIRVTGLFVDALNVQAAAGGGFNYVDAGANIYVDHVHMGSNMFCGFNIAPTGGTGCAVHHLEKIRWPYAENTTYGVRIGDGVNPLTTVYMHHCTCSAALGGGVATWVDVLDYVDSLMFDNCVWINSSNGIIIGRGTTGNPNTLIQFHGCHIEGVTNNGLSLVSAKNVTYQAGGIAGCGHHGIIASNIVGCLIRGNTIQTCGENGIVLYDYAGAGLPVATPMPGPTAPQCIISDNLIADCGTLAGLNVAGVAIEAGVTNFYIRGNVIGNGILQSATGHLDYGVYIPTGASDYYQISDNRFIGNEVGTVLDLGTGTHKIVGNNLDW